MNIRGLNPAENFLYEHQGAQCFFPLKSSPQVKAKNNLRTWPVRKGKWLLWIVKAVPALQLSTDVSVCGDSMCIDNNECGI